MRHALSTLLKMIDQVTTDSWKWEWKQKKKELCSTPFDARKRKKKSVPFKNKILTVKYISKVTIEFPVSISRGNKNRKLFPSQCFAMQ